MVANFLLKQILKHGTKKGTKKVKDLQKKDRILIFYKL